MAAESLRPNAGPEDPLEAQDEWKIADEVWMISSRGISCPSDDLTGLKYFLRQDDQWHEASSDEFVEGLAEPRLNILFVHGNRTNLQWASTRGLQAYESFVKSQNPGLPTRFIIWAWPSDQVAGPIADFRIKAQRANKEGRLFGRFLAGFPADRQVSLVAYSYGSRIVLGGLQLLAGKSLHGQRLELPAQYAPPPMRVTLIAAATANNSLLPRSTYGESYQLMERLLLVNNTADRALRLYRWLDRRSKISALGRGIAGLSLLDDGGQRIIQRDFAREIGREHSLVGYFRSARIRELVKEQVFWIDHEAQPASIADSRGPSR